MSRTEEEITRETEGTEEPCGVIVDEMDNILHMANEINQILVFHTGRFTNNLFSNLPNDVGLVVNGLLRRLRNGSVFRPSGRPDWKAFRIGKLEITVFHKRKEQAE